VLAVAANRDAGRQVVNARTARGSNLRLDFTGWFPFQCGITPW